MYGTRHAITEGTGKVSVKSQRVKEMTTPNEAIARLRKEIELAKRKSKYGNPTPLWRDVELLCDYAESRAAQPQERCGAQSENSKDNTWSGDSDWDGVTPEPIPPQPTEEFLERSRAAQPQWVETAQQQPTKKDAPLGYVFVRWPDGGCDVLPVDKKINAPYWMPVPPLSSRAAQPQDRIQELATKYHELQLAIMGAKTVKDALATHEQLIEKVKQLHAAH